MRRAFDSAPGGQELVTWSGQRTGVVARIGRANRLPITNSTVPAAGGTGDGLLLHNELVPTTPTRHHARTFNSVPGGAGSVFLHGDHFSPRMFHRSASAAVRARSRYPGEDVERWPDYLWSLIFPGNHTEPAVLMGDPQTCMISDASRIEATPVPKLTITDEILVLGGGH